MRIVLDTNVVVSGLLWRGPAHRLIRAIRVYRQAQLYTSPVLLEEFADVLGRSKIAKRVAKIRRTAIDIVSDYLEVAEIVKPTDVPRVVRDPDDDHVLACALAAGAVMIVSGDRDLLDLKDFEGITIVSPIDALAMLEGEREGG